MTDGTSLCASLAFLLAGGAASGAAGAAGLGFATSYGDHMVLQQSPKQAVVSGHCGAALCGRVSISLASRYQGPVFVFQNTETPEIPAVQFRFFCNADET